MSSTTVFKRDGRSNYYVTISDRVVSTGSSDQYLALQIAKQMKDVGIEAYRLGKRTLGDFLTDLIELHLEYLEEVDGRNETHIRKKRMQLMKPVTSGVFKKLKDVSKRTFEPWWQSLTCGSKTRNEYMTAWNVFLDWLVYEGKLNENPIRGKVRRARVNKSERKHRRAFGEDEVRRLLSVAGNHELLYLIAYVTGARNGELKQLLWADIRECDSEPCLILRAEITKNGKARTQFLTHEAAAMLAEARKHARTQFVFPSMPSHHTVNRHIKLAGIPKQTDEGIACFHSFRHTFTTTIAKMTKDTRLAQRMADHADITTTQGYMHTDESELAAVMSNFPSVRATGVSERAVKRAVEAGQMGQMVSNEVPAVPNENGTQMTISESLSAVQSTLVQGREIMEPGGIEPPNIAGYGCASGVVHRQKHRWLVS